MRNGNGSPRRQQRGSCVAAGEGTQAGRERGPAAGAGDALHGHAGDGGLEVSLGILTRLTAHGAGFSALMRAPELIVKDHLECREAVTDGP